MEPEFWQTRWRENRISFHEGRPNTLLAAQISRLGLKSGDHVFVPLCGMAEDLDWLGQRGYRVTGIELNQGAVEKVFERNTLEPAVEHLTDHIKYSAGTLTIFVGDIFALTPDHLEPVDAVYDRAALIALPQPLRARYAQHVPKLTAQARQLLITVDYDQSTMEGPPFSVPGDHVEELYADRFSIEPLATKPITGQLAERCTGTENAWLLTAKTRG